MNVWIDAQLSPLVAEWLRRTFAVDAKCVRDLGFRDAVDDAIFLAAREADAVVLSKDRDFVDLLERLGPPPRVLWLTRKHIEHPVVCHSAGRMAEGGRPAAVWRTAR